MASSRLVSENFIFGVYVPSAVIIFGVACAAFDYLPYAVLVPLILGGFQFVVGGPKVTTKALKPDVFQEYRLENKKELSHNVAIYRFNLHAPDHILGLPIGQHMSVAATIKGQPKEVVRSYTPISSDDNPGYFDLLIKTYPQGNISMHMSKLQLGQTLKVKGPKGAMVYTPNLVRHFGMIAGGTGITPMLQIIRAIIKGRPTRGGNDITKVDLIFANVNFEDILLKNDLDNLAKEDQRFDVHYVLNNPPEKWDGGVGFVTPDMIKDKFPAPAKDIKLLLCGPPPMISAMKKATESLGYDKPRIPSKLEDQVFCF